MKGNSDNGVQRSMPKRAISVLVPTRNERDNIAPLIARLEAVLPLGSSQVIFVDDSSDDTPDVIRSCGERLASFRSRSFTGLPASAPAALAAPW